MIVSFCFFDKPWNNNFGSVWRQANGRPPVNESAVPATRPHLQHLEVLCGVRVSCAVFDDNDNDEGRVT